MRINSLCAYLYGLVILLWITKGEKNREKCSSFIYTKRLRVYARRVVITKEQLTSNKRHRGFNSSGLGCKGIPTIL